MKNDKSTQDATPTTASIAGKNGREWHENASLKMKLWFLFFGIAMFIAWLVWLKVTATP